MYFAAYELPSSWINHAKLVCFVRWPTTVTAKSFYSRQDQFPHGKINFITAKSISPRQNQLRHSKINFATAKSISQTQNQLSHSKINSSTAKSILHTAPSISQYGEINFTHDKINFTQDRIIFTHGKINFTHGKIIFTTAKSFSLRQNHFGYLAHVTLARKVLWESSSSWSHESCFARTVEVVCFQQHIFACSVDKVSRNWLMDVDDFAVEKMILPWWKWFCRGWNLFCREWKWFCLEWNWFYREWNWFCRILKLILNEWMCIYIPHISHSVPRRFTILLEWDRTSAC